MSDELLAKGREIQAQLWPQVAAGPTGAFPAAKLAPDFYRYVAESAFGMLWSRPEPGRARSAAWSPAPSWPPSARPRSCKAHLRGALNVGITQEELVEVLMQTAVYAGVPAANEALKTAAEVFGVE